MSQQPNNNESKGRKQTYELVGELVRIFQRGGRWYANFQHNGRQRRVSLKTTSKKEARRRAIQLEADLQAGRYKETAKAPTLEKVIDEYRTQLRANTRRGPTLDKYEYAFALFIELARQRKSRSILDVDLAFADAFRAGRKKHGTDKPAHPKTVQNDLTLLRQIVNFALRRRMIHQDPLRGLVIEKVKPTPQPFWIWDQVERILASADEPQRSQLRLLAETGMRVSELKWLTWDDVDFHNNVIHIRPKEVGSPRRATSARSP